jgi:hypothetical protein
VADHLADPSTAVWFDLCQPTAEDMAAINKELGPHPPAVEDAVHEHQRPKLGSSTNTVERHDRRSIAPDLIVTGCADVAPHGCGRTRSAPAARWRTSVTS